MKEIDYKKIRKVEIEHEVDKNSPILDLSTTLVCDIKDLEKCINNFAKRNIKITKIRFFE